MYLIPVPAYVIRSAIHNRKVLKVANKVCHKVMGEGIKDTLRTADSIGIINLKFMKNYIKWYKKTLFLDLFI